MTIVVVLLLGCLLGPPITNGQVGLGGMYPGGGMGLGMGPIDSAALVPGRRRGTVVSSVHIPLPVTGQSSHVDPAGVHGNTGAGPTLHVETEHGLPGAVPMGGGISKQRTRMVETSHVDPPLYHGNPHGRPAQHVETHVESVGVDRMGGQFGFGGMGGQLGLGGMGGQLGVGGMGGQFGFDGMGGQLGVGGIGGPIGVGEIGGPLMGSSMYDQGPYSRIGRQGRRMFGNVGVDNMGGQFGFNGIGGGIKQRTAMVETSHVDPPLFHGNPHGRPAQHVETHVESVGVDRMGGQFGLGGMGGPRMDPMYDQGPYRRIGRRGRRRYRNTGRRLIRI